MIRIKRLAALLLMLCLLATILPITTLAVNVASGKCGDNASWELDGNGTLTISGTGKMWNFQYGNTPWWSLNSSIRKINIKKGVTTIGNEAFRCCRNLIEVTIPDSIIMIGYQVFDECESLTTITIPASVTEIGTLISRQCHNLKKFVVDPQNPNYYADEYGVLFNKDITIMIQMPSAFTGSYTIPHSVETIIGGAFDLCTGLTEIFIPAKAGWDGDQPGTLMSSNWFSYCSGLKKIIVDDNNPYYSSDSKGVFYNKDKTHLLQMPRAFSGNYTVSDSVTFIGSDAFWGCTELTGITIKNGMTLVSHSMFCDCNSLQSITLPNHLTKIDDCAFQRCYNLKKITIPSGVNVIGDRAFSECTSLESITIPNSVSEIGTYAFEKCEKLKRITIPGAVYKISSHAFVECVSMIDVKIEKGVVSIEEDAFTGCISMESIAIPDSVRNIENTFWDCWNLKNVFYSGTMDQRDSISIGKYNTEFIGANWHYSVVELSGVQPAYHCKDCNENFWLDGTVSTYTDVLNSSWQYAYVQYACDNNLMAGKGTDSYGRVKFDPNSPITREEFVQVLYNSEGKPSVSSTKLFPDVANNGWYRSAVLWAYEMGIASGMGNGNFGVGKNITRQDLAMMLYKYANFKGCSLAAEAGKINQFADGNMVAGYAKTAMNWAVTNGILSGKGAAGEDISTFRLDPAGTATRAECAAMLKNFMTTFGL